MGDEDQKILVVGGGISGITAAIEAAETGANVVIVEKNPYLGGRVAQLNQYFPKLCPPTCGLEINFRRIKNNPRISFFTQSEVISMTGQPGDYQVKIQVNPRYVNDNCTGCGKCAEVCEATIPSTLNYGMDSVKAAYLPLSMAYPFKYVIAEEIIGTEQAKICAEACHYGAIDLEMKPETVTLQVGAIIWATGWDPYEVEKVDYLGFGRFPNVLTSVMFERLASFNGPTGGKFLRPSDGKEVKTVAFVQCAGSRDDNHLPYCSGVCCLASLKHSTYIRERVPDSKAFIYYIDVRAMGKYEDFYTKVQKDENVSLIKGKIARVSEDTDSGGLLVEGEDITAGARVSQVVDLVVLAVGMTPGTARIKPEIEMAYDDFGFVTGSGPSGIIPAGCVKAPMEVAASVQDSTAAALKAIQVARRR